MSEKNQHGFVIPPGLLPVDGRFGCGPSKVRPEQIDALVARATSVMGTSHRQAPVKNIVGSVREGLVDLFGLPDGWEIVLGNGGSTVFWDVATFGLIRERSHHLVFGEFGGKFAEASAAAPHLADPVVVSSDQLAPSYAQISVLLPPTSSRRCERSSHRSAPPDSGPGEVAGLISFQSVPSHSQVSFSA